MYKAELSSSPARTQLMPLWYKAELSSSPARTKLMPLWYKAELSSSSARTKLMPLWYKNIFCGFCLLILLSACDNHSTNKQHFKAHLITPETTCSIDQMSLSNHPGPKGQIVLEGGKRLFFCDIKGFFQSYLDPNQQHKIAKAFVQDFSGKSWASHNASWIDVSQANYVFNSKKQGAMGETVIPFSSLVAAKLFIKENQGNIISFKQINLKFFEQYLHEVRERFRHAQ